MTSVAYSDAVKEPSAAFDEAVAESLVRQGKIDGPALDRAIRARQRTEARLDQILTRLGLVSEADMAQVLADVLGLPLARAADYPAMPPLMEELNPRFLKEHRVVPLADGDDGLAVALVDPLDAYVCKAVELIAGKSLRLHVAVPAELEAALDRFYGAGRSALGDIVAALDPDADAASDEDLDRLRDIASEAPVIRLVDLIVGRAIEARASDIHIEPFEGMLQVRYRIDGVLRLAEAPPPRLRAAIISRVKIMANLNIAERRLPQDGRVRLTVRGKEIDLRVSTVPTMHGESVVLRILDRGSLPLDFPSLGFDGADLAAWLDLLERPNGILLTTGPTGSGKTTTLYSSLRHVHSPEKKILTVEDPVEYQIQGINQIQARPQIGLSFATVLRSILRQDPDIIMIGEIRDLDTAQIAVQAALTGHLVLSTLHTNSAAASVSRLLDMGVENYLLTSTVSGIMAQRLVRRLCPACRQPYAALPELADHLRSHLSLPQSEITLYRAAGCGECNGTGYFGRSVIFELLPMTEPLRRLVMARAAASEVHKAAVAGGMSTIYRHGLRKALDGVTSLDEVIRVTREE